MRRLREGDHSSRSAVTGDTLAARRAGIQLATTVTARNATAAAANVSAIAGGILVFGDPLASDPLGLVLQASAFLMVIVAAALTPAPVRAASAASAA